MGGFYCAVTAGLHTALVNSLFFFDFIMFTTQAAGYPSVCFTSIATLVACTLQSATIQWQLAGHIEQLASQPIWLWALHPQCTFVQQPCHAA